MAADKGIPLNEVKKLNASASSKAKLQSGEKITFDHDATFYHENPKTGKKTYFDQVETEKMYNEKYYKEYHGEHAVSTESKYTQFAKEADQTTTSRFCLMPTAKRKHLPMLIRWPML